MSPARILIRLSQLCQAGQLKDVVQRDLFPSDQMIISLRKMFHTERREEKVHVDNEDDVPQPPVRDKKRPPLDPPNREDTTRKVTPHKNSIQVWSFEGVLKDSDLLALLLFEEPVLQENMREVGEPREQSEKAKAAVLRMDPSDCRPEFIYSIQTLNSKEQAEELLPQHMAQVW